MEHRKASSCGTERRIESDEGVDGKADVDTGGYCRVRATLWEGTRKDWSLTDRGSRLSWIIVEE